MKYSINCLKLIKRTRPLLLERTKLWNNKYYIGYNHLCGIYSYSAETISKKEAEIVLKKDLEKISKQLTKHLTIELNQNQFDSIVSLVYDIGIKRFITDEIFSVINQGKILEASLLFSRFNKYMKKPIYRLVITRKEEQKLWKKPLE